MQRLKNYISLQEAYSEDNSDLVNEWDYFLYESMVEHSFKPDYKPLAALLVALFDGYVLNELADDVTEKDLSKLNKDTQRAYHDGLPRDETLQQLLYNNYYFSIARPHYNSNFIHDPYVPNDYETRAIIDKNSKQHAINEAGLAFDYFDKSRKYVSEQDVKINASDYVKEIKQNPQKRRSAAISSATKSGELSGGNKQPLLDLDLHIKDSFVYLHNVSEFEAKVYANSRYGILGQKEPYSHKTWVWSRHQNTRHSFMDGQTVRINEPFQVLNERNGEMSNLMFPRDYARDGTGSNTINCYCEVEYHNNEKGMSKNG